MLKEIGSNFWQKLDDFDKNSISTEKLTEEMKKKFSSELDHISGDDCAFFSLGRAAIEFAVLDIAQERAGRMKIGNDSELAHYISNVVVPSYVCDTVIDSVRNHSLPVTYYDIDTDLELTGEQLKIAIDANHADIVIFHRYYGFETASTIKPIIEEYRKKGVRFIEDRTQNIFSPLEHFPVDYVVGSLRKWGAIADGGFCVKNDGKFCIKKPVEQDINTVQTKDKAFRLKYAYMEMDKGEKNEFLKAYRFAEDSLESEKHFYRMSDYSMFSFLYNFNVTEVKRKRIENYTSLYNGISSLNNMRILTKKPNREDVPLYLTFVSQDRDAIQLKLRENCIYAPIIWPKPEGMQKLSESVESIYKNVISMPIDQRYGLDDMERIIFVLKL